MKRTKFADEHMNSIQTEHKVGTKCADLCCKNGTPEAPFCNWKAGFSYMTASEMKRLKALNTSSRI